jgi:hypothetical protein
MGWRPLIDVRGCPAGRRRPVQQLVGRRANAGARMISSHSGIGGETANRPCSATEHFDLVVLGIGIARFATCAAGLCERYALAHWSTTFSPFPSGFSSLDVRNMQSSVGPDLLSLSAFCVKPFDTWATAATAPSRRRAAGRLRISATYSRSATAPVAMTVFWQCKAEGARKTHRFLKSDVVHRGPRRACPGTFRWPLLLAPTRCARRSRYERAVFDPPLDGEREPLRSLRARTARIDQVPDLTARQYV